MGKPSAGQEKSFSASSILRLLEQVSTGVLKASREKIVPGGLTMSKVAEHAWANANRSLPVSFRPKFIVARTVVALAATGFGMTIGGTTTMPSRAGDG